MPHDVIATCPVCASELAVTRLRCGECGTTIEGEFTVGRFGRLTREQLHLLETFLRSRGNLRDMERELGISYPTVRGRVEQLVRTLGFGPRDEAEADATSPTLSAGQGTAAGGAAENGRSVEQLARERQVVLERLARHELTPEEAAEAIRTIARTAR